MRMDNYKKKDDNKKKQKDISDDANDSNTKEYDGTQLIKAKKQVAYKPREHTDRTPKEQSHWYRRYLSTEKRSSIERGETEPSTASKSDLKLAKEFYSTVRVCWRLFLELKTIIIGRCFHQNFSDYEQSFGTTLQAM